MSNIIPAGSGETMQYMVHNFNDNTIRFVLRYPGQIDTAALKAAAKAVIDSVDVLHGSYIPGAIRAKWEIHDRYADEDCFRECTTDDPFADAVDFALCPVRPGDKTQMKVSLSRDGKSSYIGFAVSHLVADGSDSRYLLEKLCQAYNLIRANDAAVGFFVKNGSRAPEQAYAHLDRKTVRALMKNPIPAVNTLFPFPSGGVEAPAMVCRSISREVMDSARSRAKDLGASANDLLLTAAYYALARSPGMEKSGILSIMSMMDLRKHCPGGDSAGLCNLSGSMPTVVDGAGVPFAGLLQTVARQTAQAKADPLAGFMGLPLLHMAIRRIPHGLLLAGAEKVYGTMSVGLTNLGNISCRALALDGIVPDAGWFCGPRKKKPAMQICAASFDGSCTLSIGGNLTGQDQALLEDLLESMADTVRAFGEGML